MPDPVPANGVILPNKPWVARAARTRRHIDSHAVRLGCAAIAAVSLFVVGFDVGAGDPIDPIAIAAAVSGSLASLVLPSAPRTGNDTTSRGRNGSSYSEQVLLQVWPTRDGARPKRTP